MTADISALAQQLTDIQLRGVCKDIRNDGFTEGVRGRMLAALHSAVADAAQLAYLILDFDREYLRCGCGEPAIGRDLLGAPICATCQALTAQAIEEADAAQVIGSIPVQPDGSDR